MTDGNQQPSDQITSVGQDFEQSEFTVTELDSGPLRGRVQGQKGPSKRAKQPGSRVPQGTKTPIASEDRRGALSGAISYHSPGIFSDISGSDGRVPTGTTTLSPALLQREEEEVQQPLVDPEHLHHEMLETLPPLVVPAPLHEQRIDLPLIQRLNLTLRNIGHQSRAVDPIHRRRVFKPEFLEKLDNVIQSFTTAKLPNLMPLHYSEEASQPSSQVTTLH
ncbi:hypothetical protein BDQ17DRAFT_1437408 [Cyathus striatus]|nr:hypothetical protein BDQ17DRAFT_1437408 [Cyathus striatus]